MSHLLMSNQEPDTAAAPADSSPVDSGPTDSSPVLQFRPLGRSTHRAGRPRQLRGTDPGLEPLRRQSTSIINEVLAGTDPEEADVRDRLRWHVENNPGQPEKALLEHLLTVGVRQDASA
ncbi:hypothetical protein AB4Y72_08265 [Arthrobacter sp. YAF34]|uniref:hypothetical protein n=1 Tax=Arthrobacter sp. YAF34 TaxID=3233083 RepID=UPI003F8DC2BD